MVIQIFSKIKNVFIPKHSVQHYLRRLYFHRRYFYIPAGLVFLTIINKKFKIKKKYIDDPLIDLVNSKEVKDAGINLLESLFKDKRVLKTIVVSLKEVIKEKAFEDDLKIFIKIWIIKVLKDKVFLKSTKSTLIGLLKSKEVTDQTAAYLKFVIDDEASKQEVSKCFKEVFLSDKVFSDLCAMFEKCSMNAIRSDKLKSAGIAFGNEVLSDSEFRRNLYMKALNFYGNEQKSNNNNGADNSNNKI